MLLPHAGADAEGELLALADAEFRVSHAHAEPLEQAAASSAGAAAAMLPCPPSFATHDIALAQLASDILMIPKSVRVYRMVHVLLLGYSDGHEGGDGGGGGGGEEEQKEEDMTEQRALQRELRVALRAAEGAAVAHGHIGRPSATEQRVEQRLLFDVLSPARHDGGGHRAALEASVLRAMDAAAAEDEARRLEDTAVGEGGGHAQQQQQ